MRAAVITSEFITLGQFLKFMGIIDNGGQAKAFLQNHETLINGEPDNRRGRKLRPGDEVVVGGERYRIESDGS